MSTRRDFITRAGALAATSALAGCTPDVPPNPPRLPPEPAPDRAPEPAPWNAPGTVDNTSFAWGVQVGDVTTDAALLSVHTLESEIGITVVEANGDGWIALDTYPALDTTTGAIQIEVTGLKADTAYRCIAHSTDGARRSDITRFRTAMDSTSFRKVVIGATSCLSNDNPGWESLGQVAATEPDLFLLLGDTIYAGSSTLEGYRAEWRETLEKPSFRALCASTSLVATWDDHEVANNWIIGEDTPLQNGVTEAQVVAATEAFRESIPMRYGPGGTGLWRKLAWGAVLDVFVLDSRGERNGADQIVSAAQLDWILAAIRESTATFKLVMASVHMTDHTALFGGLQEVDRWQGYPSQRDPLVELCSEVPGVVFVTGDMHYGGVQRLAPVGEPGENVWEIAVGPGGSELLPVEQLAELAGQPAQYETLLESHSSCRFVADPGLNTLTVEFIGDTGEVLAEQVLAFR